MGGGAKAMRGAMIHAIAVVLGTGMLGSAGADDLTSAAPGPSLAAPTTAPTPAPPRVETALSAREAAAVRFADELTQRAVTIISNPLMTPEERREAFRALVVDAFDVEGIGRLLLGHHIAAVDERRMAQYREIVPDYLVPIYASSVGRILDRTPAVLVVKDTGAEVLLRTSFSRDNNESPVVADWRLRPVGEESFKVIDVAEAGVSLGLAKREEFGAVITNRGFDAFLELLHEQAGQGLPEPLSSAVKPETARSE